jgi:hypothetical protein
MLGGMRTLRSLPFAFILLLVACGGRTFPVDGIDKENIAVTISPSKATLPSRGVQQFTATMSDGHNRAVSWSTTAGTVNSSGFYSAPTVMIVTTALITARTTTNRVTATVTIQPSMRPQPSPISVTSAKAQVGQHLVDLSWDVSTSANILGYNVYRGRVVSGPYSKINAGGLVASTLYTDTSVTNGMTYYYVATVVDSSGRESAHSNQAQATIPQ